MIVNLWCDPGTSYTVTLYVDTHTAIFLANSDICRQDLGYGPDKQDIPKHDKEQPDKHIQQNCVELQILSWLHVLEVQVQLLCIRGSI